MGVGFARTYFTSSIEALDGSIGDRKGQELAGADMVFGCFLMDVTFYRHY